MANAPTRPPNRAPARRRPPRGPRLVPLSRDDQSRVDQLHKAAAHLRSTGAEELAEHVDFVLTPEGMSFVSRLRKERFQRGIEEGDVPPNFPLFMDRDLRDGIKRKAKAAGANLAAEAEHALKLFLIGQFTPAQSKRATRGTAGPKANLNVRVDADLRSDADQLGKQLLAEDELAWAPRASHVIVSWFVDRLEEEFRNPIQKRYKGRELWTADQCAESAGVTVDVWRESAPEPVWVAPGDVPMWDPEEVQ